MIYILFLTVTNKKAFYIIKYGQGEMKMTYRRKKFWGNYYSPGKSINASLP